MSFYGCSSGVNNPIGLSFDDVNYKVDAVILHYLFQKIMRWNFVELFDVEPSSNLWPINKSCPTTVV